MAAALRTGADGDDLCLTGASSAGALHRAGPQTRLVSSLALSLPLAVTLPFACALVAAADAVGFGAGCGAGCPPRLTTGEPDFARLVAGGSCCVAGARQRRGCSATTRGGGSKDCARAALRWRGLGSSLSARASVPRPLSPRAPRTPRPPLPLVFVPPLRCPIEGRTTAERTAGRAWPPAPVRAGADCDAGSEGEERLAERAPEGRVEVLAARFGGTGGCCARKWFVRTSTSRNRGLGGKDGLQAQASLLAPLLRGC
jgi:hypothetical protein